MKFILSCYTDLGNPSTPKGLEPEWLGMELSRRGELSKVIVRGISKKRPVLLDSQYVVKPIPFGSRLPLFFSAINKYVSRLFPARYLSHEAFDYFAAKHIDSANVLCCEIPSLTREMRAAKRKGMKTFVFATSAHVDYVQKLMDEEYGKFGLKYNNPGVLPFIKSNRESYLEADMIFPRSDYNKRSLIESGVPKERIYDIPLGVFTDLRKFKPKKRKDSVFRAVFVGQVSFAKGVHYLLEAWRSLGIDNAELILCGGVEPLFKDTFSEYFSDSSIRFEGHVDPLPFLQKSDVFCFPSLSEGSPQAIVEAMACGLPVIATENSGSIARDKKDGFIVPIRDSKSLAKRIKFFYDRPEKAREMGRSGMKEAKKWSIDRYAKRTADILEDAYKLLE